MLLSCVAGVQLALLRFMTTKNAPLEVSACNDSAIFQFGSIAFPSKLRTLMGLTAAVLALCFLADVMFMAARCTKHARTWRWFGLAVFPFLPMFCTLALLNYYLDGTHTLFRNVSPAAISSLAHQNLTFVDFGAVLTNLHVRLNGTSHCGAGLSCGAGIDCLLDIYYNAQQEFLHHAGVTGTTYVALFGALGCTVLTYIISFYACQPRITLGCF